MDDLQRRMDQDSKHGTFDVDPNHPAYAVRYCEMCGGDVNRHGECCGETKEDAGMVDQVRLAGMLARWALYQPTHMRVLACRVEHPAYSVREVAQVVGLGKSRVNDVMVELGQSFPALGALLGFKSPTSRMQKQRRTKERAST